VCQIAELGYGSCMTPLALTVLLVVLGLLSALVGLAWIAVPLFVLALVCLIWSAIVFARGGREAKAPVMHRTRKPELLGPGGPDDPEQA
jgi:threonine/homoserine/homoserine lactone efflux protein